MQPSSYSLIPEGLYIPASQPSPGRKPNPTHRIYVHGESRDVIQQEIEFEDFEARKKFWADALSVPEVAPYLEIFRELRDSGETSETLSLVE